MLLVVVNTVVEVVGGAVAAVVAVVNTVVVEVVGGAVAE